MKEFILDQQEIKENTENEKLDIQNFKNEPTGDDNGIKFIKIFTLIIILYFILFIIFIITPTKVLFWIIFCLIIIFSILLIISIIIKIKNHKKLKELEERKREKEKKRLEEIEEKRREEERIKEMKAKLLEKQKKLRENKINEILSEEEKNQKINEVLEDMCVYGDIMKKEIKEEKEKHPEKFVETSEALQMEKEDKGLFALGLISQNLENMGIETAIEKDANQDEEDAGTTCLQFISNGMADKKKYDLNFELDEKRSQELQNNKKEYEKFKNDLKLKLSKDFNVPVDKIVVASPPKGVQENKDVKTKESTNPSDMNIQKKKQSALDEYLNRKDIIKKGSYHIQVIFQSDEFNDLIQMNFWINLKMILNIRN